MQKKTITNILAVLGFILISLFVSLNHSSSVSAYSLTVSTSGSVTANVMPSADGGIGTTVVTDNVNIISNCRAGYTMTIAGPSDNNLYLNGDSTNNTSGTYFSPVNGTSTLNNSANANKWGYSLTANSGTGVFKALTSTPTTLKTPSQTASPDSDIDTTIPVYYGTAVNTSMAPGSYTFSNSNSITYSVVMDTSCTIYSVQYQDNGADNPNGMGTTNASTGEKSVKHTNIAEDTKITLLAPNFKKAGYAFLGWSTDSQAYTHFTDNDATNDPVIYGPIEDVVIDADIIATANSRNQINMYAVWIPALKDGSNNTIYMQEWDNTATTLPHDGCSTLTATVFDDTITDEKGKIIVTKNSVAALTDKRDNEVYAVARLTDGNCWMIENLRLEHEGTVGNNINDSSVKNQSLAQGYNDSSEYGYGKFVGLAQAVSSTSSTSANSIYYTGTQSGSAFIDIGEDFSPEYRFPQYNNDNTYNLIDSPTSIQNYKTSNLYAYGNYYSWAAAMANTNALSGESLTQYSGTSICPSGWSLPTRYNSSNGYLGSFYGLYSSFTNSSNVEKSAIIRSFPNNFVYSGMNAIPNYRGTNGRYWSSDAFSGSMQTKYNLKITSSEVSTTNTDSSYGLSIRCRVSPSMVEVVLDSNNNTGDTARIYGVPGSTTLYLSIAMKVFSRPGYYLSSWNTARDGSGTSYTSNYVIPSGSTGETLYAQWSPQYTITYVNNCYTYASANASCTQDLSNGTKKQKINLNANGDGSDTLGAYNYNSWTLTGWKIAGWSTVADNSSGTNPEYMTNSTYSVTGQSAGDGITLYAHWKPLYSIQYDGNNADNPNGMGTTDASTGVKSVKQTNVSEGDPVTLLASNFKRAGYGFAGWSTDPDAWSHFTDNNSSNDPIVYGPMETIDAPAYPTNGTNIITMYAVWVPAATSGGNPVYLQSWSSCSSLTSTTFNSTTGKITVNKNSIIALTDKRDNEVYTIARLADGNCWMVENLRLEAEYTKGQNQNDSSVTNQSLAQGYGTSGAYGNFSGLADAENSGFLTTYSANSLYYSGTQESTASVDIGTTDYPAYRMPRYNSNNTQSMVDSTTYTQNYNNTTSPSDSGTNYRTSSNIYSYGNYYTWAAAMASTINYTAATGTSGSENANTSICPSGWHLPSSINGTIKEFNILSRSYGGNGRDETSDGKGAIMSNRYRSFPNNFLYSGSFYNSSEASRGTWGRYWSRSAYSSTSTYYLDLTASNSQLTHSLSKVQGYGVRCLKSS